jgi:hypothetical protein
MATTVYNKRTQELRDRIARFNAATPFQIIFGNFDEFCGLRRLSRIQIAFARKRLVELRDLFPDEAAQALFEKLENRIERAHAKHKAREDARVAAKTAGATKGRRKSEAPVLAPPAPENDVWNLVK